jgi:hypothetical protein
MGAYIKDNVGANQGSALFLLAPIAHGYSHTSISEVRATRHVILGNVVTNSWA